MVEACAKPAGHGYGRSETRLDFPVLSNFRPGTQGYYHAFKKSVVVFKVDGVGKNRYLAKNHYHVQKKRGSGL